MHIPKIVVTGGPCGGKTTALSKMREWCATHGYDPLIVPEAATTFIGSGVSPHSAEFQSLVMQYAVHMEQLLEAAARTLKKPVMICDRGLFDQKAYVKPEEFARFCKSCNIIPEEALHNRYEGVVFLHSAAEGAEAFYSNKSNPARYETLDEARALNARTLAAWMGTSHLIIIENRTGQTFEEKVGQAVGALARLLGEPAPIETERKFLLENFDPAILPAHAVAVDIIQTYLVSSNSKCVERVRARGQKDQWAYIHTIKEPVGPGASVERERIVDQAEYNRLLVRRDTSLQPIYKTRHCFDFLGQYCELDVFHQHRAGLVILEIEIASETTPVSLPPYVKVVREVTSEFMFSNYALAKAA